MITPAAKEGATFELIETTTKRTVFEYRPGGWQLPCGCIGPGFWNNDDVRQAYCDHCKRGWWHMGVRGGYCVMLDGGKQGPPKTILHYQKQVDA